MTDAYFSSNTPQLYSSLKRYFYFILSRKLIHIKELDKQIKNIDNLFILEDETNIDTIVELVTKREIKRICVLGFTNNLQKNYINLIDTKNLKPKLDDFFSTKSKKKDLSSIILVTAFREKIKLFFKGHGEESLFDGLNWTRYFLSNGLKLFLLGDIKITELQNKFLEPGINYWEKFKQRIYKYNPYLKLLNVSDKLLILENNINSFDFFLDKLKSALTGKKNKFSIDEKKIDKNLEYLTEIDEIVNSIFEETLRGVYP